MTAHADHLPTAARSRTSTAPKRARAVGRPRSPAVSSRQIADAVVDLICERGLLGWSMRDLGGRLGLSTGTITHYFRDKQALVIAAMDAVYVLPADWERYRALPPATRLQRMTEMFVLDDPDKRRWGRFWLQYLAGAGYDPVLRHRQDERYERQRRFFSRLISAAVAGEERAPRPDADREAVRLVALGSGLAMQQVATPDGLSPALARAVLRSYLAELLGGVDRRSTGA